MEQYRAEIATYTGKPAVDDNNNDNEDETGLSKMNRDLMDPMRWTMMSTEAKQAARESWR